MPAETYDCPYCNEYPTTEKGRPCCACRKPYEAGYAQAERDVAAFVREDTAPGSVLRRLADTIEQGAHRPPASCPVCRSFASNFGCSPEEAAGDCHLHQHLHQHGTTP
jgi:hypothetical protein